MKIDNQTLIHLEKLAKITIDNNDRETATQKIANILTLLDEVNEKELDNIQPLHHPLEINQYLRPDNPNKEIDTHTMQTNAPAIQANLFLVPKVIE